MKNHKGAIATLLTLGLVIVGTLITLGTSLMVNNKNTNIASNPRATGRIVCDASQCKGTSKCYNDNDTAGGYSCCKGRWVPGTSCILQTPTPTPTPKPRCIATGNVVVNCCFLYDYGKNGRCNKDKNKGPIEQTLLYYGSCMGCVASSGVLRAGECDQMDGSSLSKQNPYKCISNPILPSPTSTPIENVGVTVTVTVKPISERQPRAINTRVPIAPETTPSTIRRNPIPTTDLNTPTPRNDVGGTCEADGRLRSGYVCASWDLFGASSNDEACKLYSNKVLGINEKNSPGKILVSDLQYDCNFPKYTCCRPPNNSSTVLPIPTTPAIYISPTPEENSQVTFLISLNVVKPLKLFIDNKEPKTDSQEVYFIIRNNQTSSIVGQAIKTVRINYASSYTLSTSIKIDKKNLSSGPTYQAIVTGKKLNTFYSDKKIYNSEPTINFAISVN